MSLELPCALRDSLSRFLLWQKLIFFSYLPVGPDPKGVSWILTEPSATQVPQHPHGKNSIKGWVGTHLRILVVINLHADSTYHSGSVPQGTLLYFMAETGTRSHATVRTIA